MINVLIVVYNKNAEDSQTCMSLIRQTGGNFRVFLWDNSDYDHGLKESCRQLGWTYLGGKGNLGLSKAYNSTVSILLPDSDKYDYLCTLDDDTKLPDDYFSKAESFLEKEECRIAVPIIFSGTNIISPWRAGVAKHRRFFKNTDKCVESSLAGCYAFNSGMLISFSVFSSYSLKYDERLVLDGVDISFLRSAEEKGIRMCLLTERIENDFSAKGKAPKEVAIRRFESYLRDMAILYEDSRFRGKAVIIKHAVNLSIKYRTAKFVKAALRNGGSTE